MPVNPSTIPEQIAPRLAFDEQTAAELLSISTRSLQRLRESGQIGYLKIGGRVTYPVRSIKDFIRRKTTPAHA